MKLLVNTEPVVVLPVPHECKEMVKRHALLGGPLLLHDGVVVDGCYCWVILKELSSARADRSVFVEYRVGARYREVVGQML
jgi:hypothetical protein